MPSLFPIVFYCLTAVVEFRYQRSRRPYGRWRGGIMVTALALAAIVGVTASQYAVVPKLVRYTASSWSKRTLLSQARS
jgi:hypothetical protein